MHKISSLFAREILDSRGNPTVEVSITLDDSIHAVAAVPSGASTGVHEAVELRDGDKKRYGGKGVTKAVANVNKTIYAKVLGQSFDQKSLDQTIIDLDGTANKGKLGANAILGVSMAFARAAAVAQGIELYEYLGNLGGNKKFTLPTPMLNVINGGAHADSGLDIQEFMIGPVGFPTFARKIQAGQEVITALKKLLSKKGYSTSIGDEGGFAPHLKSNEEAFELLTQAVKDAGYNTKQIKFAIDAASSSFFEKGVYNVRIGGKAKKMKTADMIRWYEYLVKKYPIISIEDGLSEDDWDGFTALTKAIGKKITIVGDDLLVTNISRIKTAIEKKAANSVLIKLNQIGSVSETVDAITMAQNEGWIPFMSHRSGETVDTFIADLAVAYGCQYIKAGSLARGERVAKYNRLMEIESKLK